MPDLSAITLPNNDTYNFKDSEARESINTRTKLKSNTASTLASTDMGTTANRQYAVGFDKDGNLSVNIPWTDHTYNFAGATFTSGNGTTGEHNANNMTYNGCFYIGNGQNGPPVALGVQNADSAVFVQAYNATWVVQLAQDYRDGQIFVRSKKNGVWQDWKAVPMFTTTNGAKGSATQPLYINADGMLTPTTHTLSSSVPADAVFTDTTYEFDGTYNASTNKAATVSTVTNAIADNVPSQAAVDASGLITYKNSGGSTLFTLQLPLYNGGVS